MDFDVEAITDGHRNNVTSAGFENPTAVVPDAGLRKVPGGYRDALQPSAPLVGSELLRGFLVKESGAPVQASAKQPK